MNVKLLNAYAAQDTPNACRQSIWVASSGICVHQNLHMQGLLASKCEQSAQCAGCRWSDRMAQHGLEKVHWRKHWQWFEISRKLAHAVVDDDIVRPPACACCVHVLPAMGQAGHVVVQGACAVRQACS